MSVNLPRTDFVPPEVRLLRVWHRRWLVIVIALACAALTYAISREVPGTYKTSAEILVSVPDPGGLTQNDVDATNDLANQYQQLVVSDDVIARAASELRLPFETVKESVAVGTVASENLISIAGVSSSADESERIANTVAQVFLAQRRAANRKIVGHFEALAHSDDSVIASEITRARSELGSSDLAQRDAAASELPQLLDERASEASTLAQEGAVAEPDLTEFAPAGPGTETLPKPTLFAVLAFLLAFAVAAQAVSVLRREET